MEVAYAMRTRKLTYVFHNPNTEEATANFLVKLFTEVNQPKLEAAIRRLQEQRQPSEVPLPDDNT